jgi:hypothetical protein
VDAVGVIELADVFADLARNPGGEQVPEPGHAQVDLTARERMRNIRRDHYELGLDAPPALRVAAAFTELAQEI